MASGQPSLCICTFQPETPPRAMRQEAPGSDRSALPAQVLSKAHLPDAHTSTASLGASHLMLALIIPVST